MKKFMRQDVHKKKRLKKVWRKARGSDSKVGHGLKGYRRKPGVGFKTEKKKRGTVKGLKIVYVNNLNGIKKVDKEKEIAVIGHIGMRKKAEIAGECLKSGISVLNVKDINKFLKDVEEGIKKRKESKKKKDEEKSRKVKEKEKKGEKKEGLAEKVEEEEKKKGEKKEKDKILTKREV